MKFNSKVRANYNKHQDEIKMDQLRSVIISSRHTQQAEMREREDR